MAIKTIYVKDENVALYEKAEELSGKKFSDLVASLVREYVLKREEEGDYYAVCLLDETADGIPSFTPAYFIKAPTGTPLYHVRTFMQKRIEEGFGHESANILYPLLGLGGEHEDELKMQMLEGELDIVEFTD